MITQNFINQVSKLAQQEIDQYHAPSQLHYDLAIAKGKELARLLNHKEDLVTLGTILMDIKLGEAFSLGKLDQHVKMSLDYAKQICESNPDLSSEERAIIYNSVASHHGAIPHSSIESEIVTNADCYRFIHPTGVTWWNAALGTRTSNFQEIIGQLNSKLQEKWKLVSLPVVKKELEPYYLQYSKLFEVASKDF